MSQLVPILNFGIDEMIDGDYNMYQYDYQYQNVGKQIFSLEGLHSGVPTNTTPTLTPTTLRSIDQPFLELSAKQETHKNEAGFVPPLVQLIGNNQYISASDVDLFSTKSNSNLWPSSVSQSSSDSNTRPTPPVTPKREILTAVPHSRRNMGGRKPQKDVNISPEEEERRKIRRERNKAAAARCRKRRVDHTNSLIEEVESLEKRRESLQIEYEQLQDLQKQLEEALSAHQQYPGSCKLTSHRSNSPPDIKPIYQTVVKCEEQRVKTEMIDFNPDDDDLYIPSPAKKIMFSSTVPISKPSRPNSLNVAVTAPKTTHDLMGFPLQTPSTGIPFNFESLMEGRSGLTPVTTPLVPNCSAQQRIPTSTADLQSPDSCNPPKLVSL